MNKKFSLIIILLCVTIFAYGQINIDYTKKLEKAIKEQNTAERAINGCVVIVRQSYQVKNKKTGRIYGRSGRKDFGHNYSLGIKTEAGLVVSEEAIKPWHNDNAFKKIENDYNPYISLTEVRTIEKDKNTEFSQCPLKINRDQPDGVWIANSEDVEPNSMEIDLEGGYKDGYLVWFMTGQSIEDNPESEIVLQVTTLKSDLIPNGESMIVDTPIDDKNIIGGIYIFPRFLGGGHISYRLVGLTVKDGELWKLLTPFIGYSYHKGIKQDEVEKSDAPNNKKEIDEEELDVELTPIENGKKSKKINDNE